MTASAPARNDEDTWQNLCGRQGYLVVRGGKIVQTIITLLN